MSQRIFRRFGAASVLVLVVGTLLGIFNSAAAYNRSDAVYYADLYWNSHNYYYPSYEPNDCTNFVSQVLSYGGLSYIWGSGVPTDYKTWWYDWTTGGNSNSWSAANTMDQHAWYYGNRYEFFSSAGYLNGGDFILMDLVNDGVTSYTHARVGVGWLYDANYGTYVYDTDQHSTSRYHVKWDLYWDPNTQPHEFVAVVG